MAKSTPQQHSFSTFKKCKDVNNYVMYAILLLSIACAFFPIDDIKTLDINEGKTKFILDATNILLIIVFSLSSFIADYYIFPEAEKIRRSDFIDNSMGSKFNITPSEGYFSNDAKEKGLFKAALNLFENCLFTFEISSKMLVAAFIKTIFFAIIVAGLAIYGFASHQAALPILQLFFSANILGETIKLFLLNRNTKKCFDSLHQLFNNKDFVKSPNKHLHSFLHIYVIYETNLASAAIPLDSEIYNKLNPILSKQWEEIKTKLSI